MNRYSKSLKNFDPLSPRDAWVFSGRPYAWAAALTRETRLEVFFAFLTIIISSVMGIIPSYFTSKLVDEVFVAGDLSNFWWYVSVIFLVPVIRGIIMFIKRLLYEYISQNAIMRARDAFYQHLQKLDQDYYSKTPTGRIMARLTGDLEMVRHFLAWSGFSTIETAMIFVVALVYLFFIEWRLALITSAVAPILLLASVALLKKIKPAWRNIRQQFEKLNSVVQQNINGNRTTRAFVRHDYEVDRFQVENLKFSELNKDATDIRARYIPLIDGLSSLMYVALILFGGMLVIEGNMTVGNLVLFNNSLWMLIFPMRMLGYLIDDLQHYASSANKIIELFTTKTKIASPAEAELTEDPQKTDEKLVKASLESPVYSKILEESELDVDKEIKTIQNPEAKLEEKVVSRSLLSEDSEALKKINQNIVKRGYVPDKPFPLESYTTKAMLKNSKTKIDDLVTSYVEDNHIPRIRLKGEVQFDHVSYDYTSYGQKVPALHGINFTALPGQTIGIIGETGSGKTTLIELISRLADPSEGRILIDGRDLRTYPLEAVRRSIHVVTQDVFLFSDTVESNIAFSDPLMSTEEVYEAARLAVAHDFILKMDEGYDTIIGEEGVGLSGGQRQRISLARALAGDPDILILDDTTSAVDMNTDAAIRKNLKEAMSDKTVFMIAQRISSIRNADQIFVMENGRIVERGTHEQLLDLDGIYKEIYDTQIGDSKDALGVIIDKHEVEKELETRGANNG